MNSTPETGERIFPQGGKILVTGGTGFVGPKIVHALRAEERPVRALVRDPRRGATLEAWGCELVRGDMTDAESLRHAVEGCDAVVHLVAIIAGRPSAFERLMIQGTRDLVAAAREAGVGRFVLMSALGTSERSKDLVPYYRAKWAMEQAVSGSGIDSTIFRPSFVFGRDGGILPMFVRQARYLPVIPIAGDGNRRLQPIWVEDVAQFFARSLSTPEAVGRTFDLGGPDTPTWNELFEAIKRALGTRRPTVHIPVGLLRANAAILERLPRPPVTRDQLTMLEFEDNVGDIRPAVGTFGIEPITLEEQLRRAV
jgi:NADH dehydrogenase